MFGVLINVGSSSSNPNGRGRVFSDCTFEFIPIPELRKTIEKVPTYRDLGFSYLRFPDLSVHLDPEFETFTYGHVRRGFGDIQNLLKLKSNGVLFFYATLQKDHGWAPYIMGYFKDLNICDCRDLSSEEIFDLKPMGFANNAHLKRVDPHVDFLIKGGEDSRLLKKAFPLAEEDNHLTFKEPLRDILCTATGKNIESGTPWFRWTLTCEKADNLIEMITV
jgi:hypothetical protein